MQDSSWEPGYRLGFVLEEALVGLCAVLWILLQGAVSGAWVNWEAMTWWARSCYPQMGRSGLWGTDTSVAGPPQGWVRTHSLMPCQVPWGLFKSVDPVLHGWITLFCGLHLCRALGVCRNISVVKVNIPLVYLWKTGCQVQRGLVPLISSRRSALRIWYSGLRCIWS